MRHRQLLRLAVVTLLLALPVCLPAARAESDDPPGCAQHGICVDCAPAAGQRLCTFTVCDGSITTGYFCGGCFDECATFP